MLGKPLEDAIACWILGTATCKDENDKVVANTEMKTQSEETTSSKCRM